MKKRKLSKRSALLLDKLLTAAKDWGWESDQGWGPSVDRSKEGFEAAVAAMEDHLRKLEAKVKQTRSKT